MRIRWKVILVVLPLLVVPLFLAGLASIFTSRNGITQVATELLRFKAEELATYAQSQWNLLVDNGLSGRKEYVDISKAAVQSFAASMIKDPSELIFAVDRAGAVQMKTGDVTLGTGETAALASLAGPQKEGWQQVRVAGVDRVGQSVVVAPFGWYVLVTATRDSFYHSTNEIIVQSIVILGVSVVLVITLLFVFSGYLTKPLRTVVDAMRDIIGSRDLSRRVALLYRDETGELGHTFNLMTGELQRAYEQIRGYALETAIAKTKEQKVKTVFQRYVPRDVIDRYLQNPEAMLVGEDRDLAMLFSDIRDFTRISETLDPAHLVETLNSYFEPMVNVIMERGGIVDKYIGDCIMAFFGAPVGHPDDAHQALASGFDMLRRLALFNEKQYAQGRPEFRIGIGIDYGKVTVGNIGPERKMDYTVIGDRVNLASRLEGLTKVYKVPLVFSDSLRRRLDTTVRCRMLDRVAVKGRVGSTDIYTARPTLSPGEEEGWGLYDLGVDLFYKREFAKAESCFADALKFLPGDAATALYMDRCWKLRRNPPDASWRGVTILEEK